MHRLINNLAAASPIRHALIPLFRRVNAGDITISHHWTGERIVLHSFRHKGYWFHGRERERESMALCAQLVRKGDVVFDVGGHIGYMALYFASLVGPRGKVYSFEPAPTNLPYIRANVSRAANKNVVLVEEAVGAENRFATFWSEDLTGQNGSLIPAYAGVAATAGSHGVAPLTREVTVGVVNLDSFAESLGTEPSFVKIDVEGAESLVLHGMRRTLAHRRPRLMIEVTNQAQTVFKTLAGAAYGVFDEKRRRLRHPADAAVGPNLFAIPDEDREARWKMMNWHE